ncbi:MAG: hypothetical protein JXB15_13280 [Anaerolineales bacterium]|nr:hypothetical protein [Anaerolineales bacterium]
MRSKTIIRFILVLLLGFSILLAACIVGDGGKNGQEASSTQISPFAAQATLSANATATFGAQQFHLQLTAIAREREQNQP